MSFLKVIVNFLLINSLICGYEALIFKNSKINHSFNDLLIEENRREINDSLLDDCMEHEEYSAEAEENFIKCYCGNKRVCFNLYCNFHEVLVNDQCQQSDIEFKDLKLKQNIVLIYDKNLDRKFKSMIKVKPNSVRRSNLAKFEESRFLDIIAIERSEADGKVKFYLVEYCDEKEIEDLSRHIREWTRHHKSLAITVNAVSLICLIALLIIYSFVVDARTSCFTCWMGYGVASIIDISLALYFASHCDGLEEAFLDDNDEASQFYKFILLLYICVEFTQYIWISIIFYHVFLKLVKENMCFEVSTKRFIIYNVVAYVGSILITLSLYYLNGIEVLSYVITSRVIPHSTFDEATLNYVESIGIAEIITKSACVVFYVLGYFFIWISGFGIQNVGAKKHESKKSVSERIVGLVNRIILVIIVIGSLICNITIYLISKTNDKLEFCHFGLLWLAYLNPAFEIIKRLNGLNVLFLVLSNMKILCAIMKKFGYKSKSSTFDRN